MSGVVFEIGDREYDHDTIRDGSLEATVYRLTPERKPIGAATRTRNATAWVGSAYELTEAEDASAVDAIAAFLSGSTPHRVGSSTSRVEGHFSNTCPVCNEHVVVRAIYNQDRIRQCSTGHWVLFRLVSHKRDS